MSLVLRQPRPAPVRGLTLCALVVLGTLPSALSLAPTLVRTSAATDHAAVCHCAHCPGDAKCCCGPRQPVCP